jgi:uncharacterized protein YndB with AHSA1/START domain
MENKNAMKVIAEEGKQEVIIVREFDATAELVFKAFTTPEILISFFAPPGTTMGFHYHDYRSDGRYSWYHKDANGSVVCTFNGVIHEMTAPDRLVQTAEFMELPERGHVILERMLFEALPGDRTRLTIHDVCFSVEDRDAMVQSGMASGLEVIFDRLDSVLPKL